PVAFPSSEERRTHRLHERMIELEPLARLLARDLADVGGIHRHPGVVPQEDLGPAVLRLADVGACGAERLVAEGGGRHPDAVDIARRYADGSHETDEERVDVAALAAEVPGLEHGLDVTHATAPHLWLAVRVGADPVVDRRHFLYIRRLALGDLVGRHLHYAVRWYQVGRSRPPP